MDPEVKVVMEIAEKECRRVSRQVIRALQRTKEPLLSGDDTLLENTWDEVCVQVQGYESIDWEFAYLPHIKMITEEKVRRLDSSIKKAIWLQTPERWDWDEEEDPDPPYTEEEVVNYIVHSYVLAAAADWTNERIYKFNVQN